jgi:3-oxoadipate enol-lactonase
MSEAMLHTEFTPAEGSAEGGATVVLLHSLALDSSIWAGLLPRLTPFAAVLRCDLPGHGRSPGLGATTIEEMADAVAEAVRERVSTRTGAVVVWGMSLGGSVAQAVAARHPDLVDALGLSDTTAWYGEQAPLRWAERAQVAVRDGMRALSGFQLDRWFSPDFLAANQELAQGLLELFATMDIDSYVTTCTAMGTMDLREATSTITMPTTITVGELDPATPVVHAHDLADRIAGSRIVVIPGCSHLSPLEAPELFAREVEALCRKAVGRDPITGLMKAHPPVPSSPLSSCEVSMSVAEDVSQQIEIDSASYRRVLSTFATGVVAIAGLGPDGIPTGLAANSFSSVSLDPPLVSFCVAHTSSSWPLIKSRPRFSINILAEDQHHVCTALARKGGMKFDGLDWSLSNTGCLVIDGATARLEVTVEDEVLAGDHVIVIARVQALCAAERDPLVFFQGAYGRFQP